jgi:hypothetical protein
VRRLVTDIGAGCQKQGQLDHTGVGSTDHIQRGPFHDRRSDDDSRSDDSRSDDNLSHDSRSHDVQDCSDVNHLQDVHHRHEVKDRQDDHDDMGRDCPRTDIVAGG